MQNLEALPTYRSYWIAWVVLLILTLAMVFIGSPAVLIAGMAIKAAIIVFWYMHLRFERMSFVMIILIAIFATSLVLFYLIAPDGKSM